MCEVVKVCKFFFTTNLTNVDSMWSYSVVRRLFVCLFFPGGLFGFSRMTKAKRGKPTFVSSPNLTLWRTSGRTFLLLAEFMPLSIIDLNAKLEL